MSRRENSRYLAMDGVRGVAAISVVLYHATTARGEWAPGAYLAVEIFFCLSGFVLGGAYKSSLDGGWGASGFLKARVARLYPLYALGLALGVLAHMVALALGAPIARGSTLALMVANSVFMAPTTFPSTAGFAGLWTINAVFPFNPPSWSLFFELVSNAVFGVFRPTGRRLAVFLALLLIVLVGVTHAIGYAGGWGAKTFWAGAPRALFEFYLGYGVRLLVDAGKLPRWRTPLLGPVAVILVALAPFGVGELPYFGVSALIAPAILAVSLTDPDWAPLRRLYQELGRLSYPLYALHWPALKLFIIADVTWFSADGQYHPAAASLVGFLAALILASLAVANYLEPTLRRSVSRALGAGARGETATGMSAGGFSPPSAVR